MKPVSLAVCVQYVVCSCTDGRSLFPCFLLVVAVLVVLLRRGGCSVSVGCAGSAAQVQVDVLLVLAVLVVLLRSRWMFF